MHDVLPHPVAKEPWLHTAKWRAVEGIFRTTCRLYGYREIRTPVMEPTELFTRSIGEGTDIVTKEMFTFMDRGGRSMTLRPEGTAPALRAYVEHRLYGVTTPVKLYYIETIYRYERGQKGRYREHQQTGVEALGSDAPAMDAEVISLAMEFYRRLGLTSAELRLNSLGCAACRPQFRQALIEYAQSRLSQMSEENQLRFRVNPLRMLDSKDERDREALADAPKLVDYLCSDCAAHFDAVKRLLDGLAIRYTLDAHLVRGFDYYTRTAFEIVSPGLGAQNSIGGGGRYDGLVEQIGGPPAPGIGFGIGTERCLLAMEQLGLPIPEEDEAPDVFLVSAGGNASEAAVRLAQELRREGIATELDYQSRSLKAQMRAADRTGARFAVILGEDELARSCAGVKPLRGGGEQLDVPLSELVKYLKTH